MYIECQSCAFWSVLLEFQLIYYTLYETPLCLQMAPHRGMGCEWGWVGVAIIELVQVMVTSLRKKWHVVPLTKCGPTHMNHTLTYEKSVPKIYPCLRYYSSKTYPLLRNFSNTYIRSFGICKKHIVEPNSEIKFHERSDTMIGKPMATGPYL